ncbi:MAG TPA: xylulokinase [Burkholderiaceae bacterium]|nr:xylulokinase [Burkholderiaceae bacterium]
MFLGIDMGTSEVKALLLDSEHHVVGTAGSALQVSRPHPGHSEQTPADWWQATQNALASLRLKYPREYASVKAIGLSGQMHGAVLLDRNNAVLRPAILWNDTRSSLECEQMMAECPALPQIAGTLAMPGFTAPKLRWVATHEPAVFAQIAKVLLPKDYVRLLLTGEHVSDMSDASGTMWLDVEKRAWSPELLALTGLDVSQMPRLVEGHEVSGILTPQAEHALGLPSGIVVAGGAGDNAASAIGMGAVNAGEGFLSLGTSGVLFVVTPRYQPNAVSAAHAFCHAVPDRWHQMSVMLSAASSLQWITHLLGADSEATLEAKARALNQKQRAGAPLFLPYLSGERTPHNDANIRGSFHELSHDTDATALAYSVMEGVTFGLTDGLRALKAAGSMVQRLSLVGGGARSELWAQQLATMLDVEIVTHEGSTAGGALGAARLAWLATGAPITSVCTAPEITRTYRPDLHERPLLTPRYERFRALYPAVRAIH